MLKFEWDEEKNIRNKLKHRVSFETAVLAFNDKSAVTVFDRYVQNEQRMHLIGKADNHIVLLIVYVDRNNVIRIISARRANKKERKEYELNTTTA